jgi:hypothetical protein
MRTLCARKVNVCAARSRRRKWLAERLRSARRSGHFGVRRLCRRFSEAARSTRVLQREAPPQNTMPCGWFLRVAHPSRFLRRVGLFFSRQRRGPRKRIGVAHIAPPFQRREGLAAGKSKTVEFCIRASRRIVWMPGLQSQKRRQSRRTPKCFAPTQTYRRSRSELVGSAPSAMAERLSGRSVVPGAGRRRLKFYNQQDAQRRSCRGEKKNAGEAGGAGDSSGDRSGDAHG